MSTLYYLHTDHLGSTSVTTCGHVTCGTLGAVLSRHSYYPYGGVRQQSGTQVTKRGYTSQYDDGLGGLLFYNARYYLNGLARFVSADTLIPQPRNLQAFNRFMYSLGNPIKYIDPSGHETVLCDDLCDEYLDWDRIRLDKNWGAKIKAMYLAYRKAFKGSNLQDFLSYVLTREFNGMSLSEKDVAEHLKDLQHSTTHAVYLTCEGYNGGQCSSGITPNMIFNWLGGYSQSAKHMTTLTIEKAIAKGIDVVAQLVTEAVFNPPDPEWQRSRGKGIDNEPVAWGNRSLWVNDSVNDQDRTNQVNEILTLAVWSYGLEGQDIFYIITNRQRRELEPYRVR